MVLSRSSRCFAAPAVIHLPCPSLLLRMLREDKKYVALVEETADGVCKTTPLVEQAKTKKELTAKIKADEASLKKSREALNELRAEEPKRYKRATWVPASRMDCIYDGEKKQINVLLTDSWRSVKEMCMEAHGIMGDPDKFVIDVRQTPAMSKKVRGKTMPAEVGEFDIWESRIALFPASESEDSESEDEHDE